jgi:hypothetical protein
VIKHLKREDDALLFPPRRQFLNELASLNFLHECEIGCGPRLYASDADQRMMIVEDLGQGPSLQDVLMSGEAATGTFHLTALGGMLGRIQEATSHRSDAFTVMQATLGVSSALCGGSMDVRNLIPLLHECLDALSVAPNEGFDGAVAVVGEAMIEDPRWRTFAHFDAGPHNCITRGRTLKLIDFEFAGLGNGLIDLVGARMAFPVAYHGRRVPEVVVDALESNYRVERLASVPAAGDDTFFRTELARACAHWALTKLWGFWKDYLRDRLKEGPAYDDQEDRGPQRAAYFRQMIFTYLLSFVETARQWDVLPELRSILARVMDRLRIHWPDLAPWPFYPAFAAWS